MQKMKANGLELCYETFGDESDEPLVLIMGLGAQMILWPEDFCEALADRGFHVVRFDNRDIGLSTWLDDAPTPRMVPSIARGLAGLRVKAPYTLEDMATDVAGLLDGLGHSSAHIVGASLGGMVAQTLAIHHPERVRSLTSIMSNTGDRRWLVGGPKAMLKLLSSPPKDEERFIEHQVELLKVISGKGYPVDDERLRDLVRRARKRSYHPRGVLRQMLAVIASGSRTRELARVQCPTLVVHGSDDPLLLPGGGAATARAIPGAQFDLIQGMGHDLSPYVWPRIVDGIANIARTATARDEHAPSEATASPA